MRARLITQPSSEPISLSDAKAHLRVTSNAEDVLISQRISMIRHYCENQTQISLMPQTWELVSDWFCCEMLLPHPPVQSIASIKYFDVDGVEQTIPSADYVLDNIDDLHARVVPASGKNGLRLLMELTWFASVMSQDIQMRTRCQDQYNYTYWHT